MTRIPMPGCERLFLVIAMIAALSGSTAQPAEEVITFEITDPNRGLITWTTGQGTCSNGNHLERRAAMIAEAEAGASTWNATGFVADAHCWLGDYTTHFQRAKQWFIVDLTAYSADLGYTKAELSWGLGLVPSDGRTQYCTQNTGLWYEGQRPEPDTIPLTLGSEEVTDDPIVMEPAWGAPNNAFMDRGYRGYWGHYGSIGNTPRSGSTARQPTASPGP